MKRDRAHRKAHITLLREDGSGADYTHPGVVGEKYLQLPHAYWTDEWDTKLSLPAKAALLVARSMPADFFLLMESAPNLFGFSADTLEAGLRELRERGLLHRWIKHSPAPLTTYGYVTEYRYKLLPPFARGAGPKPSTAAAAPGVP